MVVGVALPVRHPHHVHHLVEALHLARPDLPAQDAVLSWVVVRGLFNGHPVVGAVGQAEAVVVGLDAAVALAGGLVVVVDLVLVAPVDDPCVRLPVKPAGLAPHPVGDPGHGGQIAFVGGVDEHLCPHGPALACFQTAERERAQAASLPVRRLQLAAAEDGDPFPLRGKHPLEQQLGDVGLEVVSVVAVFDLLGVLAVLVRVMVAHGADELQEDSAHSPALLDVGRPQPVRHQTSDMGVTVHQHHARAQPRGGERRRDAAGCAAVDGDVRSEGLTLGRRSGRRRNRQGSRQNDQQGLDDESHGVTVLSSRTGGLHAGVPARLGRGACGRRMFPQHTSTLPGRATTGPACPLMTGSV